MAVLLIVIVIFLVLLVGLLLAFLFSRADHAVTTTRLAMEAEERSYNPAVTLGHKIKVQADYDAQLKEARRVAAVRAAALPRGANTRIGRAGQELLAPASKGLQEDPQTAVRIARFHGWDGARVGPATAVATAPVAAAGARPATAAAPAAAASVPPPTLIEITDSMSAEEVRKARIANAKAESAYNKALKAAAAAGGGAVAAPVAAAVAAPAAAAAGVPAAAGIEPPKLIAITPDMAPEDVRKARVANAKAEAAYNKALKAAGVAAGTPAGVEAVVNAEMPGPATAVAHPEAAAPPLAGVEPPKLIEITPDMAPEDVRKARVANAKAEAAYNKALKAAGVDPASLRGGAAAVATATSAPAEAVAAAAPPAPAVPTEPAAPAALAGIPAPALIEITDSMSPEEVRRARVENAKAMSAYNKALKAAGIDPATVK